MKEYTRIDELIGNTPLLRLTGFEGEYDAKIYAKLELFNPMGSVKDRAVRHMLDSMEKRGELKHGSVIIEPTSGNTGIALAAIGTARGYKIIIVMPNTMSRERQQLMRAYGAEVILTDGALGMSGAIAYAKELKEKTQGAVILGQFENPDNAEAHVISTGPEIYRDTDGEVDIFVAGVGTGGTLTGVAAYLKSVKPGISVVAVEPHDSPFLSLGKSGAHKLQGIGAGFKPAILDTDLIDEIITVTTEEAYGAARRLAKEAGVLVGISSGAAVSAAASLANRAENRGKRIVVLLADSGERYLSTELFGEG